MNAHVFKTRFGTAGILYRPKPFHLAEVLLPCKNLHALEKKAGFSLQSKAVAHKEAIRLGNTIERYFAGESFFIPWEILDLDQFTLLQKKVYETVAGIPWGGTMSYGKVAEFSGCPNAARFVGTTMAKNPYPVLIPCHRVVRSNGSPGQFGGGPELKKQMLALEKDQ